MISKAFTLAAIAAIFLASDAAQAQTTATFSTTSQQFTSGLSTFNYNSNSSLKNTVVKENVLQSLDMGFMTGFSMSNVSGTGSLVLPITMKVSTGETIDFSITVPVRNSVIPYGGPSSYDYSLSVGSVATSVPINNDYTADFNFNGGYSGTYTSTTPAFLTATATIRRNSPPGIPEPGVISLLALGGLALAGTLLQRKSR